MEELTNIKGIGEYLAESIINYRLEHGDFKNIEEIMLVSGIGEGIFSQISGHIFVENPIYEEEYIEEYAEEYIDENYIEEYFEEIEEETEPPTENPFPININTADIDELMLLPYVTEETAIKITELRDNINGFQHPYELLYVEGIEQQQLSEIVELVVVE